MVKKTISNSAYAFVMCALIMAAFVHSLGTLTRPAAAQQQLSDGNSQLQAIEIVTGSWPPYVDDTDPRGGLASRIVEDILLGAGYLPELHFMPFATGLRLTDSGAFSATFPYFRTPERERQFLYSDAIFALTYHVFTRSENDVVLNLTTLSDLQRYQAGIVEGYAYGPLEPYLENSTSFASEVAAFRALFDGQVDYVAAGAFVGDALLDTYFLHERHDVARHPHPNLRWSTDVHLIAPRSRPDAQTLIDQFNVSLETYRQSGGMIRLQQLSAQREETRRQVRLTDPGSFSLIVAREHPQATQSVILPRGTRAIVLEWSSNFVQEERTTIHQQLQQYTRVRILNGPLKDRVVWVQNMYIEVVD